MVQAPIYANMTHLMRVHHIPAKRHSDSHFTKVVFGTQGVANIVAMGPPSECMAHMEAEVAARRDEGAGPSVFAAVHRRLPYARRGYPWW